MFDINEFASLQMDDIINEIYPNPLYQALSSESLLDQLDQERFQQIGKKLSTQDVEEGMDLLRFVQVIMQVIPSEPNHIIYMTIGLMEMFREVSEYAKSKTIRLQHLSDYVCDWFSNDDNSKKIKSFKVPAQKTFDADKNRVREIDLFPPLMLGTNDDNIKHLLSKIQTDSLKHNYLSIKQGAYSSNMDKIITLDQLATSLNVYDLACAFEYRLKPKSENETVILDFAWSDKQQRLGMTLKDHTLCFCDKSDNFKFEKRFNLNQQTVDYQSAIWYLEFNNLWVTTDISCALNVWNLETEELSAKYLDKQSQAIVEVQEIVHLKLIAIAQRDKKILLWELLKNQIKLVINLQSGGINKMLYSYDYQVLLTSGYDNKINIYSVHITMCDYEIKGSLIGHASMVTAVQIIANTPLIVSTDDYGSVRLWDIRSLKCVQELTFGNKSRISKIIDISQHSLLAFIGSRLNVITLQSNVQKYEAVDEQLWVVGAEYDAVRNNFIVCTKRDIRIINSLTGRVTRILNGLLDNPDDDIICFSSLNQFSNFIIGDIRGKLKFYKYHNSEELFKLQSHTGDVLFLVVDSKNNLLITAGSDGKILVQQLVKPYQQFRELTNIFDGKAITDIEVSVHHNLIFACCSSPEIVVYDYELGKMLSFLNICGEDEKEVPTHITVINGFALVCIASNRGLIYILKFIVQNQQTVFYDVIAILNLNDQKIGDPIKMMCDLDYLKKVYSSTAQPEYGMKIVLDTKMSQNKESIKQCQIMIGTSKGRVVSYNLKSFMVDLNSQYPHASKRMNYNAFRTNKETYKLGKMKMLKEPFNIRRYVLQKYENILNLNSHYVITIQAHKEQITGLSVFEKNHQFVVTTAQDGYMKVWNPQGNLEASFNINHPLAISWDIKPDNQQKFKKQFIYAMKIIQILNSKQILKNNPITNNFNEYLKSLLQQIKKKQEPQVEAPPVVVKRRRREQKETKEPKVKQIEQYDLLQKQNVIVMKDEYSPRDIRNVKSMFNPQELYGSNLKTMAVIKKKEDMKKEWTKELDLVEKNNEAMNFKEQTRLRQSEKELFFPFLEEDYHQNFLDPNQDLLKISPFKRQFNKKLESHVTDQQSQRFLDSNKQSMKFITCPGLTILSEETSKQSKYISEEEEKQSHILKSQYQQQKKKIPRYKTKNSQDFYDYAFKNVVLQDNQSIQDVIFDSSRSVTQPQIAVLPYLQKKKRERMQNILNALDSNLKQSQSNTNLKFNHSTNRSRQTLDQSKVNHLPSITDNNCTQATVTNRELKSSLKIGSQYASLGNLNSKKKYQDFSFTLQTDEAELTKLSLF